MSLKRVEFEIIIGNDNWRDRRTFEAAQIVELKPGNYLHIKSESEGEFYCSLTEARLSWIQIEPVGRNVDMESIDSKILVAMGGAVNNFPTMIPGIKLCRELTGKGLKEAKDYCEALRDKHRIPGVPLY